MLNDSAVRMRNAGLLLVRVGLGLSFIIVHGWSKLFGGPDRWEQIGAAAQYVGLDFLPVFWGFLAAFGEVGGGLLLLLGLFFRPATALMTGVMVVAAVMHIATGNGSPWHAIELGIVFLGLFLTGPGAYSLDDYTAQRRRRGF